MLVTGNDRIASVMRGLTSGWTSQSLKSGGPQICVEDAKGRPKGKFLHAPALIAGQGGQI